MGRQMMEMGCTATVLGEADEPRLDAVRRSSGAFTRLIGGYAGLNSTAPWWPPSSDKSSKRGVCYLPPFSSKSWRKRAFSRSSGVASLLALLAARTCLARARTFGDTSIAT